jgi:hypothetical protein
VCGALVRCVLPPNGCKGIRNPGGCQVPLPPMAAEAVRLGFKVVSRVWRLPFSTGLDSLTVNDGKAILGDSEGPWAPDQGDRVSAFREYRARLADKIIIVENRADGSVAKVIRQAAASRYFAEGRRRIKARISKRMGGYFTCAGLLVSLTFDPKLISKSDAWRGVGELGRRWLDGVNRWRVREGMPRVRGIKVLELQPGTGYPHLHYAFPKLRWLAPREVLRRYWRYAAEGVDWRYRDSFSPAGYVCKYISKMEGWSDEGLAEIWLNRTRLYSMSRDYYLVAEEKRVSEWTFRRSASRGCADVWLRSLVEQYETVLGANDLVMEVFIGSGKG